jgi:hypothetical protein
MIDEIAFDRNGSMGMLFVLIMDTRGMCYGEIVE